MAKEGTEEATLKKTPESGVLQNHPEDPAPGPLKELPCSEDQPPSPGQAQPEQ